MNIDLAVASTSRQIDENPRKISKLELKIQNEERRSQSQVLGNNNEQCNIDIEQLCQRERLPFDENVLSYWENSGNKNLKAIAEVVLATPATQVSVERAFSGLAHILTCHRTNIKEINLNNTLLLKLNYKLFEKIDLNIYNSNN